MKSVKGRLKNDRGIALLISIFFVFMVSVIVVEVSKDTGAEYVIASNEVDRVRAYYAAKSGLQLGLLRVLLYQKAVAQFGDQLKDQRQLLDLIWSFDFVYPPEIPEGLSQVSSDLITESTKDSYFGNQTKYYVTIKSEGSKIDINNLGSSVKPLAEGVREQILRIFQDEVSNNDAFYDEYRSENFEELGNNMADWVDANQESLNGGSEANVYPELDREFYPPNEPFKTLDEIRLVAGMNDDFFNLIKDRVTVFGVKGVNINYAKKEVLMALDEQLDEEAVDAIQKQINDQENGGPFPNIDAFKKFAEEELAIDWNQFNKAGVPLLFEAEYNFRITSIGQHKNTTREIEVVTYNIDAIKENLEAALKTQDEREKTTTDDASAPTSTPATTDGSTQPATPQTQNEEDKKKPVPQGRPNIVYWWEN